MVSMGMLRSLALLICIRMHGTPLLDNPVGLYPFSTMAISELQDALDIFCHLVLAKQTLFWLLTF